MGSIRCVSAARNVTHQLCTRIVSASIMNYLVSMNHALADGLDCIKSNLCFCHFQPKPEPEPVQVSAKYLAFLRIYSRIGSCRFKADKLKTGFLSTSSVFLSKSIFVKKVSPSTFRRYRSPIFCLLKHCLRVSSSLSLSISRKLHMSNTNLASGRASRRTGRGSSQRRTRPGISKRAISYQGGSSGG